MKKQFALLLEPIDYQLTVHYNNYDHCFGKGSFYKDLEWINQIGVHNTTRTQAHMSNLILTYGYDRIIYFMDTCVFMTKAG